MHTPRTLARLALLATVALPSVAAAQAAGPIAPASPAAPTAPASDAPAVEAAPAPAPAAVPPPAATPQVIATEAPPPAPPPYAPPAAQAGYVTPGALPAPRPPGPDRSGFTLELSLGLGVTTTSLPDGSSESRGGISGGNLTLGGFITSTTALGVRFAHTSFFETVDDEVVGFVSNFIGPALQVYLNDRVFLGGGVGIGYLSTTSPDSDPTGGIGLDLRAGYNFYVGHRNAFSLSAELTPGFYDHGTVTGFGLQLGWQLL